MLFTLIVAAAAGAATPYIEDRVTEAMARALGEARMPDAAGRCVAAFAAALFAASVLLVLVMDEVSPVLVVLGGAIGVFQTELRGAVADRRR
jgi:heme O synthase-like polyprenyltransferase